MEDTVKEGLAEKTEIGRKTSLQKTTEDTQRPMPETTSIKTADRPGKWKTKE